jgi:hypothetical protein
VSVRVEPSKMPATQLALPPAGAVDQQQGKRQAEPGAQEEVRGSVGDSEQPHALPSAEILGSDTSTSDAAPLTQQEKEAALHGFADLVAATLTQAVHRVVHAGHGQGQCHVDGSLFNSTPAQHWDGPRLAQCLAAGVRALSMLGQHSQGDTSAPPTGLLPAQSKLVQVALTSLASCSDPSHFLRIAPLACEAVYGAMIPALPSLRGELLALMVASVLQADAAAVLAADLVSPFPCLPLALLCSPATLQLALESGAYNVVLLLVQELGCSVLSSHAGQHTVQVQGRDQVRAPQQQRAPSGATQGQRNSSGGKGKHCSSGSGTGGDSSGKDQTHSSSRDDRGTSRDQSQEADSKGDRRQLHPPTAVMATSLSTIPDHDDEQDDDTAGDTRDQDPVSDTNSGVGGAGDSLYSHATAALHSPLAWALTRAEHVARLLLDSSNTPSSAVAGLKGLAAQVLPPPASLATPMSRPALRAHLLTAANFLASVMAAGRPAALVRPTGSINEAAGVRSRPSEVVSVLPGSADIAQPLSEASAPPTVSSPSSIRLAFTELSSGVPSEVTSLPSDASLPTPSALLLTSPPQLRQLVTPPTPALKAPGSGAGTPTSDVLQALISELWASDDSGSDNDSLFPGCDGTPPTPGLRVTEEDTGQWSVCQGRSCWRCVVVLSCTIAAMQ